MKRRAPRGLPVATVLFVLAALLYGLGSAAIAVAAMQAPEEAPCAEE